MQIEIAQNKTILGRAAAAKGAELIRAAIAQKGAANIILATGASQFEMLAALVQEEIDWPAVACFHLDEYIGLPITHPASFRRYLKERFASKVPVRQFYYIDGEADEAAECRRLEDLIRRHPIDVAFIGIGENGHLAFNDPPADFDTDQAYLAVTLDEACRRQQLGEGWFENLAAVPERAISMSIQQILKSECIICTVPDQRKAKAVQAAVEGPVTPDLPASILQRHDRTFLFLDGASAGLLDG
jgi:glucosamine-6-phosphate deaminase